MSAVMLLAVAAALVAWAGTAGMIWYGRSMRVLDIPNERSSHTVPTPRGGGVAIVAAVVASLTIVQQVRPIDPVLYRALMFGGIVIALTGLWDDHRPVLPGVRLVIHGVTAGIVVYMLGGWNSVDLGNAVYDLGFPGSLIAVLALVWLTNLYNFMDGIDGLAASEALTVGVIGGFLVWGGDTAVVLHVMAAASLGFLLWNWPPARIFMGDVGSGFIGFMFGVIALYEAADGNTSIWPWLLLLAVFIADASVTLVSRACRGEKWWTAHRKHAYQKLAHEPARHLLVTTGVLAINLAVLAPLAALTIWHPEWGLPITAFAYVALAGLALMLGAGRDVVQAGHGSLVQNMNSNEKGERGLK